MQDNILIINKKISIFSFVCISLSACSPIPELLRPKLEITILNQQNEKMDNVDVVLNVSHQNGKWVHYQEQRETKKGKVIFPKVSKINFLNSRHQTYFWSLCVYKEGYEKIKFEPPKGIKNKQQLSFILKPNSAQNDSVDCIQKGKSLNRNST